NDKGPQVDDTGSSDTTDEVSDIACTPASIDFGALSVVESEIASQLVTCTNTGLGALLIEDLYLSGEIADQATISAISTPLIQPDGAAQFSVTYTPTTDSSDSGAVMVRSNDPDTPVTQIDLQGEGLAPILSVSAAKFDFGTLSVGCEAEQDIEIRNDGRDTLTVDSMSLSSLGDFIVSAEALPWSLEPDESLTVTVRYSPLAEGSAATSLILETNDPSSPQSLTTILGAASSPGQQIDTFSQRQQPTDVLIAVDSSGSLGDERYGIWTNFSAFTEALGDRTDDYRIALVVQDSGAVYGDTDYIDSTNVVDADEIASGMLEAMAGGDTEKGFTILLAATAVSDWLRADSQLNLVGISDEPEQSDYLYTHYVSEFQSLRANPADVRVHGIGGDYPGGCDSAQPYTGMYEATVATGGGFLSICTKDWQDTLRELVAHCGVGTDDLSLSAWPVVDTIAVTVGGQVTEDWVYDDVANTLTVLTEATGEDPSVAISYTIQGECD
ncbi:MAG: hypothetical protein ACI8RZ_004187, partial [Myxococcota bacterium]